MTDQRFSPKDLPPPPYQPKQRSHPTDQEEKRLRALAPEVGTYLVWGSGGQGSVAAHLSCPCGGRAWARRGRQGAIAVSYFFLSEAVRFSGGKSGMFVQSGLIIPGHPTPWICLGLGGIANHSHHVVEGVDAVAPAGLDQTHEQVADISPSLGSVKEAVFAIIQRFQ